MRNESVSSVFPCGKPNSISKYADSVPNLHMDLALMVYKVKTIKTLYHLKLGSFVYFIIEQSVDFFKKSCFPMRHILNLVAMPLNKIFVSEERKIHK